MTFGIEVIAFFNCWGHFPAIWLAESIFANNSRTRFFQDIQFSQNCKDNYGASFIPKILTHQWTKFCSKYKKPYFWGIFWHYLKSEFFFQKIRLRQFSTLRHPNFMQTFRTILWAVFKKNGYWPTDWLTDWLTDLLTDWQTDWQTDRKGYKYISMEIILR